MHLHLLSCFLGPFATRVGDGQWIQNNVAQIFECYKCCCCFCVHMNARNVSDTFCKLNMILTHWGKRGKRSIFVDNWVVKHTTIVKLQKNSSPSSHSVLLLSELNEMQKKSQIQSGTRKKNHFYFLWDFSRVQTRTSRFPPKETSNYSHIGRGKKCGKKVKIYIQTSSGHACSGSIATTTITIILVAMAKPENLIFFLLREILCLAKFHIIELESCIAYH